jgi:hypothetical protein
MPSNGDGNTQRLEAVEGNESWMPCPCCATGRLKVFGEAVFFEHEAGRQSGEIEFKEAQYNDSALTWESRLDIRDSNGGNASSNEAIPAKMGFRAGVGCSDNGCWQVRGLSRYSDIPVAIFAAAALAAARRSLKDHESLDLAAIATDLEADPSRRSKLFEHAQKWIGWANGGEDEEFSPESFRQIATELLDSFKA